MNRIRKSLQVLGSVMPVLTRKHSQVRMLIHAPPDALLHFRASRLSPDAEIHERRSASLEFYRRCINGDVDYAANSLLAWMNRVYPDGWHGASSAEERIELCRRFHQLLKSIEAEGVQQPVRMLEPSLFGESRWLSFHDGGNRTWIASSLGLERIPCLVHPRHYRQVKKSLGLLA
jgi:hypothetical protein